MKGVLRPSHLQAFQRPLAGSTVYNGRVSGRGCGACNHPPRHRTSACRADERRGRDLRPSTTGRAFILSGRFGIVPATAVTDPQLGAVTFRVLAVLSTFADREGWCWPKQQSIGDRMGGMSRQAVARHLRDLEGLGYIESSHRYREDGGETSKLYRLLYDFHTAPVDESTAVSEAPPAHHESAPPVTRTVTPPVMRTVTQNDPIERSHKNDISLIDEGYISGLIEKHRGVLSEDEVRESVKDALAHKNRKNWDDVRRYVAGWVRRSAGWKSDRPGNRRLAFNNDAESRHHGPYDKVVQRGTGANS